MIKGYVRSRRKARIDDQTIVSEVIAMRDLYGVIARKLGRHRDKLPPKQVEAVLADVWMSAQLRRDEIGEWLDENLHVHGGLEDVLAEIVRIDSDLPMINPAGQLAKMETARREKLADRLRVLGVEPPSDGTTVIDPEDEEAFAAL